MLASEPARQLSVFHTCSSGMLSSPRPPPKASPPSWPPGTQARLAAATQTPHRSPIRAPESTHFAPAQTSPAWAEPSSQTSPTLQPIGAQPKAQAASLRLATFRREHGTSPLRQARQALQPTWPLPLAEVPAPISGNPHGKQGQACLATVFVMFLMSASQAPFTMDI